MSGRFSEFAAGMFEGLWSSLWPALCPFCNAPATLPDPGFCPECAAGLRPIAEPLCLVCGRPLNPASLPPAGVCGFCGQDPPAYELARSFGRYEGVLAQAIRDFKFRPKRVLAPTLGRLLAQADERFLDDQKPDAVIPVPLHPRRLRERGFNQAADLARPLARRRRLPILHRALSRRRNTEPQFGLSMPQRLKNLKGAFHVPKPNAVKDKTILLVDDVLTTGLTVNECARALKAAGAKHVLVLTLARTS